MGPLNDENKLRFDFVVDLSRIVFFLSNDF